VIEPEENGGMRRGSPPHCGRRQWRSIV